MAKNDDDNRSNQLNPNNHAYTSSRSGGHTNDDNDDGAILGNIPLDNGELDFIDEDEFLLF